MVIDRRQQHANRNDVIPHSRLKIFLELWVVCVFFSRLFFIWSLFWLCATFYKWIDCSTDEQGMLMMPYSLHNTHEYQFSRASGSFSFSLTKHKFTRCTHFQRSIGLFFSFSLLLSLSFSRPLCCCLFSICRHTPAPSMNNYHFGEEKKYSPFTLMMSNGHGMRIKARSYSVDSFHLICGASKMFPILIVDAIHLSQWLKWTDTHYYSFSSIDDDMKVVCDIVYFEPAHLGTVDRIACRKNDSNSR